MHCEQHEERPITNEEISNRKRRNYRQMPPGTPPAVN